VESQTHAEYKQVTVLFADVVHSMGIAAAVDMERREIMTELAQRSAAVVRRYGEAWSSPVMAVFGAPASLEDHDRLG
jgi:class 3 adenylate cyclase